MIPAPFTYARPTTVDEALQAIAEGGEDVKILAGGQSLIPVMRLRLAVEELETEYARAVTEAEFDSGESIIRAPAVRVLVESLLQRGADDDLREAQAAMDKLAAIPTDPDFVVYELSLLRLNALLARANGDEAGYRDYADRYRRMATSLRLEGEMALAEAMT